MKARYTKYWENLSSFFKTKIGKIVLKWVQYLLNAGILMWLVYELSNIGWRNLWVSLPLNPFFYLFFLFIYIQLPLFEILIYRLTWTFNCVRSIPVFLLKRVYNKDVIGYSGEIYFYLWAQKNLGISGSEILKTIKDNNIISSAASTLVAVALLSIFLFTDQIVIMEWFASQEQIYYYGGGILMVVLTALLIRFRHFVISMPLKTASYIFGIQTFRLVLVQALNVLMYYIVMPDTPLYIWLTLISVEIILTRIPLLPNRDLIYVGMSIGITEGLPVSASGIAGIMLAKAVLNKAFNFIAFGLSSFIKQTDFVTAESNDQVTDSVIK